MNLTQALKFIQPTAIPQARLGLDRIRELMNLLGYPQKDLRFVHVAGTNGKGSVCAMLASILQQAGYTTGLYTSPHLLSIHERIRVNGDAITSKDLIRLVEEVKLAVDQMMDIPSEFERITAMALLYFKKRGCDIVVLEVGMGGRLDSTNIISSPDAAVITNIGLDHTEYLGNTLSKIAGEKAGIIKENTPTILYEQSEEVTSVIQQVCLDKHAPLFMTERKQMQLCSSGLKGQYISYRKRENLFLPLLGTYQIQNAAVVLDTVDVLNQKQGYHISEQSIKNGLCNVQWPGRFEVLLERPLVLVDGAHNPNGVEQLVTSIREYLPDRKITFVMGVMADKDYGDMIQLVAPYAKRFIAVVPNSKRALDPKSLKDIIEAKTDIPTVNGGSVKNGLKLALNESGLEDTILIFGSLYQVGEVRTYFGKGM